MDECRAMVLTVKGPDVNESRKVFAVSSKGEIRFGLAAIKGVGAAAVEAIIEERDKNGPYKDIYDMMERIRPGACNRASMETSPWPERSISLECHAKHMWPMHPTATLPSSS